MSQLAYSRLMQRHVAKLETVGSGVHGNRKGPRPARSYRGARRNLARALRFLMLDRVSWRQALKLAAIATAESMKPAVIVNPKPCPDCGTAAGEAHCLQCAAWKAAADVTPSSGNVFADIGLPEPDKLLAEAEAAAQPEPVVEAPAKPKRVRKPKAVVAEESVDVKPKRARKPAAPKADATPKAPKKTTAKAAPKTSIKPAAAPRKRAPAKTKAA